jgi:hypothetical protein
LRLPGSHYLASLGRETDGRPHRHRIPTAVCGDDGVGVAGGADLDVGADDPRVAAAQYFGTKGFFAGYDARLDEPLTEAVRSVWLDGFEQLEQGTLEATKLAAAVQAAESQESPPSGELRGDALLRLWE